MQNTNDVLIWFSLAVNAGSKYSLGDRPEMSSLNITKERSGGRCATPRLSEYPLHEYAERIRPIIGEGLPALEPGALVKGKGGVAVDAGFKP